MALRKHKFLIKYFDRKGTGEISAFDFTIRLLGYLSFILILFASLGFLCLNLF